MPEARPMTPKLIILEANEIPLRIFRHYARCRPRSTVARLLEDGLVLETVARDVPEPRLYPSQTWASLNTGVPYEKHRIHWYNDPKPREYPLYWQILADHGRRVGLVNTLHSSPAARMSDSPQVRFLIPDCFAEDPETKPARYGAFQRMNLKQTQSNRRVIRKVPLGFDELGFLLSIPSLGIRLQTLARVASVVGSIAVGRANRERLRNLQFFLLQDVFHDCLRRHEVDLAILFTNHVAASMHRYWYALFPEEYDRPLYGEDWVRKYRGEILHGMDLLDEFLGQLVHRVRRQGAALALVTSMGQCANRSNEPVPQEFILVREPQVFFRRLLPSSAFHILSAMEPQYSLRFGTVAEAAGAREVLSCRSRPELSLIVDQQQDVLTVTLRHDPGRDRFMIDGQEVPLDQLGMSKVDVDDSHVGRHHPAGSLIVFNSPTARSETSCVDYLEFAPAVCEYFGIPRLAHMKEPSFRL